MIETAPGHAAEPLHGTRVIVAGAGLAGLSCAWALHGRGADVRVLEARHRVGGRVETIRSAFAGRQYGEAGGELIEESHDALIRLARRFRLRLVPVLAGGFGAAYEASDHAPRLRPSQDAQWVRLRDRLAPALRLWRTADRRWDGAIAAGLRAISIERALREAGADDELLAMARALRGFFAEDADRLSVLVLLDVLGEEGDPASRRLFRIAGGADRLPAALAQELGAAVTLNAPIISVAQRGAEVVVTLQDPVGAAATVSADFLVLALPAPIVRDLAFDPPLPDPHARAYGNLTYGRATKTLLQFDRPFWRRSKRPRAWATDLPIGAVWEASEDQAGTAGVLALLAAGRASDHTRARLDAEGAEGLVPALSWLGGTWSRSRPRLLGAHVSRWDEDPWARGAYASFTTEYDPASRPWLARPAGRIHFAGEHTSWAGAGYMNGAVESGWRAAAEIEAVVTGRAPLPLL